jgi:hypothetical protein
MANTRTLNSKTITNAVSLRETIVYDTNPMVTTLKPVSNLGRTWNMDGTTGPAVTAWWEGEVTMTAGALSLDLTALTDAVSGLTVDMTGKKIRSMWLFAPTGNAGAITIKPHVTDGYTGWTSTGGQVLSAGDYRGPDIFLGGIAVDATHKILHVTGTGTDKLRLVLLFGT